jgi:hypothetical protein
MLNVLATRKNILKNGEQEGKTGLVWGGEG